MEGSFQPSTVDSVNPTATDNAAATSATDQYPAWVLLEKEAYYHANENATTAEAKTFTGHTVKVTFFLADPPAVSCFGVHGPDLEQEDLLVQPRAVFSEKDLVLLRFVFSVRPGCTVQQNNPAQYFVYEAGHGKPSLTPIPTSGRPNNAPSYPSVVPFEDGDVNFLVADLAMTSLGHYDLHIFSTKTYEWTTRPLQLQIPPAMIREDLPKEMIHKVIALGAGTIGWIDLWRGIIVCNVLHPDPVLHFIPLPKPEFNLRLEGDPRQIRDVTCCNGFIKFIEMEHYPYSNNKRNFRTTKDLDSAVVLHDSELFLPSREDLEEQSCPLAWKIRTCYRHTSWNLWCKGHTLHVDDILVKTPSYYTMLPELWDDDAGKFTLRNLTAFCPTLSNSIHGGDIVYLVSKVGMYDEEAWVVGVDFRNKTVEVLEPYRAARSSLHQMPFLACTFPGYLNTAPRSCAPEDQNYPLNIIQNNLNMQIVHPVNGFPIQPQLAVPPQIFPQTRRYKFIPTGPAVHFDEGYFGQLPLLMPPFQPQMPQEPASSAVPFNTLMPQVPMDDRFLSQMPSMPASLTVPFNTLMPRVPMDARFLSQVPPVPVSPAVPFNTMMPPVPTVHHS